MSTTYPIRILALWRLLTNHCRRMSIPTFKTFITEKEVEEVKKKRQEEWEKVRRPDQPLGKLK